MAKVISWALPQWKENLGKRLKSAKDYRLPFEAQWNANRATVYNELSQDTGNNQFTLTFDNVMELEGGEVDSGDSQMGTNLAWKYVRFRHGQFSANPPSAIASPTSMDHKDQAAADAADRLIRWSYADGNVQEMFDQQLLKAFVNGSGWIKQVWDPEKGDIFDFNEETSEILMEGDISTYVPSTFDIWVDPLARTWEDCRFIFEAHQMSVEEAMFRWPDKGDLIRKSVVPKNSAQNYRQTQEDVVIVYEYWEKAAPINGMAGRHAFCLDDGTPVHVSKKNFHPHGQLPYYPLTDSDVEDCVYGKALVEYVIRKQQMLNRFDSAAVDAMTAHGVIRLLKPEATEIPQDVISNSNYDIVTYSGNIPPTYLQPPALPPDMARIREQIKEDIQDLMSVNDSQLGIQKRETSGFSQQTAIEAGNINNRRLFNKYSNVVRQFWKDRLNLIQKHWTLPRTILVMGEEHAFEAIAIKGADIAGGFDIKVDYGTSLPLDPNMRREQIMLLMQPLQQAGMPMQRILQLLKLNELDVIYDEMAQSEQRQREIFDTMVALFNEGEEAYIAPQELEDHDGMLLFCKRYRNSMEYKVLHPDLKPLIERHIKDRMAMAAQVKATGSAAPGPEGAPPEMAPPPGALPPQPQEMVDNQAQMAV